MSSSANPFLTVAAILAVLAVGVEPQGAIDILVVKQNELFHLIKGLETILNSIKNEPVTNEQLELLNNKVDAGLETILNSIKNESVTNKQLELLKKKVDAGLETILNSIKNEPVTNEQLELLNNKVDAGLETILNSIKNESVTNKQLELLKKKVDAGLETILNSIKNEPVTNEQLELLNNKVDAGLETILNSIKNESVTNKQLELLKKNVDADFGVLGRSSQSLIDSCYLPANFRMPILDFLHDIAQGKNTSSSSIFPPVTTHKAMMAIDNSAATSFFSNREIRPWWLIDLGSERVIYHILILSRQDCCSERLHDLEIRLGNSLETPGNFYSFDLLNFFIGPYKKEDGFLMYTFVKGVKGRYLSLQIVADTEEYLQLTTVKVIGLRN